MRVPEDGINSYFSIEPRLIELFSLLSDENAMKVISYAETLSRNNILTKECISKELGMRGVNIAVQCCEHLNRAVVIERETALKYGFEEVNVVPQPHAGGAFAVEAYKTLFISFFISKFAKSKFVICASRSFTIILGKYIIFISLVLHSSKFGLP